MIIPGKPLHAETQRHVARMSVRNSDHIEDLDLLIRELIFRKLWSKLYVLCVAGPNNADSLLDLKGLQDSALEGAPVFTANEGFTTTGSTSIDMQWNFEGLSSSSAASFGYYAQSGPAAGAGGNGVMGSNPSAGTGTGGQCSFFLTVQTDPTAARGLLSVQSGSFTAVPEFVTMTTPGGHFFCGYRANGSQQQCRIDGSTYTLAASGEDAPVGANTVTVGRVETGYAPNTYSAWFTGSAMSAADAASVETALHNYFTRRGTAF